MSDSILHVGTADWRHTPWRGRFYPLELQPHAWLAHYAKQFNCVELDAGQLSQLDHNLAATWCSCVAADFRFCIQMPRAITHVRKLRNVESQLEIALNKVQLLESHLGPCLFSLPPHWHRNLERLQRFMEQLPQGLRYAFEFQDADWLHPDLFALLHEFGMALVITDKMPLEHSGVITCDFGYMRLYGPTGKNRYTAVGLRSWAARVATWRRHAMQGFVLIQQAPQTTALKHAALLRDYEDLQPLAGHAGSELDL